VYICRISPLTKMHLEICNETLTRTINIGPVVPKLVRAVTKIKVAIMSYYPQYFAS